MKTVQGGLLVVVGLGILWLAVTGRLDRLGEAWKAIRDNKSYVDGSPKPASGGGSSTPSSVFSAFPGLPATLSRAFS